MKPASWIHVALGGWLIAAPFVLGYSRVAAGTEDLILGLAVLFVAVWEGQSLAVPSVGSVIQLMLAAWIFVAPFALKYVGTFRALANDIVVALILTVTSVAMIAKKPVERLN